MSIKITKRNTKVWTNVDQHDLDREITEERRKGWQQLLKQIRKDHTIPMTLEELQNLDMKQQLDGTWRSNVINIYKNILKVRCNHEY